MALEETINSDGVELAAYWSVPALATMHSGIVLCHGLPVSKTAMAGWTAGYYELSDRIARDVGWPVLAVQLRGIGDSGGNFSIGGWVKDVQVAVDQMLGSLDSENVWLVGSSLGGSICLCAAASDPRVRGVATLGAPAELPAWSKHPKEFLELLRATNFIRDKEFPVDKDAWMAEIKGFDPIRCATELANRHVLILHGSQDMDVPLSDADRLSHASGGDLRVIDHGTHRIRHDPRAIAILLGWLARHAE